jgi:uncharacterized hydrophobic protein (TIGR00271 family)
VPRFLYYLLLLVSAGIAAFGLLANSAAVVIGAMLVSPLMTPIFGIALALCRGDVALLRDALLAEFGGVALVIVFAMGLGTLPFALEVTPEMLARTSPTLIDLLVATLAGFAGGLALVDERTSPALPGVAIATSLTPPLATSGLSLAFGAYAGAWGAFLLFFANFLAILAVSTTIFVASGFVTRRELGSKRDWIKRFSATAIGLLAVASLLTRQLVLMVEDWQTRKSIETTLESSLREEPGANLAEMVYEKGKSGSANVLAVIRTPRVIDPLRVKTMEEALAQKLGRDITLFVRCTITKDVAAAGSVQLSPKLDMNGRFSTGETTEQARITETAEQVLRQLLSERQAFTLLEVNLYSLPSGRLIVASVQGARMPVPVEVAFAEDLIRKRIGDERLTLVARSLVTSDVTARGRILLGQAHFDTLTPEQASQQAILQEEGRKGLELLGNAFVTSIDAAPLAEGWEVRAQVASPGVPTPKAVAQIEKALAGRAGTPVWLSVWATNELVVFGDRYDSIQNYAEAQARRRIAARTQGAASNPPADAAPSEPR